MRVLDILQTPLVAIDVGTSVTRLRSTSEQLFEQPSVVRELVEGRFVSRPAMRNGVVADIAGVAGIVDALLSKRRRRWRRPGAVVCAPTDVSEAERDALVEAIAAGGASAVAVVPEPLAAALGAGVDVSSEYATAILDIGEGVTDFAVIRNGSIVRSEALRIGCGALRSAVRGWVEFRQDEIGALSDETIENIVRGYCRSGNETRSVATLQAWKPVVMRRDDLDMLLEPVMDDIASFIAATMRDLPDQLAAEIIESGIHATGGGAKLGQLVARIEERVGLPLTIPDDPLAAVINGAARMLRSRQLLKDLEAVAATF